MGGGGQSEPLLINLTCLLLTVVGPGPGPRPGPREATLLSATPPTGFVTLSICSCQGLLNRNITVLLEILEESRQAEANLTAKLRLREGRKNSGAAMKGDVLRTPPRRYS